MENQPVTNPSENSTLPSQPPVAVQTKTSLIVPILLTVLISAAVFGVGGYYFGKKSLPTNTTQYQAETSPNPSIIPSPTSQQLPTQTISPTIENTENQIGYIKSVFTKDGRNYLTIDYVQWLSNSKGECRSSSEKLSNIPECNPNGYLVVNSNSQIRTFEINKSVVIDFSDFKNTGLAWKNDQPLTSAYLTSEEFQEIFSGNDTSIKWLKDAIYRIELSKNAVIKIRYQYQP